MTKPKQHRKPSAHVGPLFGSLLGAFGFSVLFRPQECAVPSVSAH